MGTSSRKRNAATPDADLRALNYPPAVRLSKLNTRGPLDFFAALKKTNRLLMPFHRAFMAGRRDAGARPVMSAFTPRAMPDDLARLYVLEATIEILKTENEILKRRLAAVETWAAQAVITNGSTRWRPIGSMRWRPSAPGRGGDDWRASPPHRRREQLVSPVGRALQPAPCWTMSATYIRAVPTIDLTDDELAAVTAAVRRTIETDRFPRAPRLDPLRSALTKLEPATAPKPTPHPKAPPPAKADKRARR